MSTTGALSARIAEYERSLPDHRAGTVETAVLQAMERFAPSTIDWSMETGCGKTTILLSNLSAQHHVFAFDDRTEDRSSIRYYEDCPLTARGRVTEILGATQLTVPRYAFTAPIDLALLDGPHGYPFPELEYYFVYPHLRTGALLVIDDIHIPTIHRLHTFLAEDEMFELVHIERTTSFFVRTSVPAFYPLGDGWEHQAFNKARFPAYPPPFTPPPAPAPAGPGSAVTDARVRELEQQVARLEAAVAHWQHVADARRLKRRLARRLGEWEFLK
jgi:Methyltransferase domain